MAEVEGGVRKHGGGGVVSTHSGSTAAVEAMLSQNSFHTSLEGTVTYTSDTGA